MPQSSVSHRQCWKTAALENNNSGGCEVIRHAADRFLNLRKTSGISLNLLIINNYRLAKFTPERSVYIYFKIYIPAAVTVVRNGNQQRKMKCQS